MKAPFHMHVAVPWLKVGEGGEYEKWQTKNVIWKTQKGAHLCQNAEVTAGYSFRSVVWTAASDFIPHVSAIGTVVFVKSDFPQPAELHYGTEAGAGRTCVSFTARFTIQTIPQFRFSQNPNLKTPD